MGWAVDPFDAFMRHVHMPCVGECWKWTGATNANGYGHFKNKGKDHPAHRFAYERFVGPIPVGKFVCHSCDNRWCVNPKHLFVGTQKDNMRDCVNKGRIQRGERHRNTRLTDSDVRSIRSEYSGAGNGPSLLSLAKKYGVCQQTIHNIVHGVVWSHVA